MNDPTWPPHEEAVCRALARNGVPDPSAALCALLWLLRDRHRHEAAAFAIRAYREGFELPDPGACTIAETLLNEAACLAVVPGHGEPMIVPGGASITPAMRAVADVLGQLIAQWDCEVMDEAARAVTTVGRHGGEDLA